MKKYALYIGRWQNWHKGHEWLINQQLNQGKNVWGTGKHTYSGL